MHNYAIPHAMPHTIPQTLSTFYPHRFEMRNELFGDKLSECVHFELEFTRLGVQQPHKFLDVNKYIQLYILASTANELEMRWKRNLESGKIRSEFRLLTSFNL